MEINDNKNVEKDELTGDKLISGHEYDNIRELDNQLPRWWVWLFVITVVWGVVYVLLYDVFKVMPYPEVEYANEMAMAGGSNHAGGAILADTTLKPLADQGSIDAGKAVWTQRCVVCHLAQGQGLVGPNLTDNYSIHGCRYCDIVNVITNGVPEKGMISWKAQISKDQIMQVASYVMTLKGSNPPNPKAPQGDPCK
jgi:cytochrome c oxidase cbb3-type subunit 3